MLMVVVLSISNRNGNLGRGIVDISIDLGRSHSALHQDALSIGEIAHRQQRSSQVRAMGGKTMRCMTLRFRPALLIKARFHSLHYK